MLTLFRRIFLFCCVVFILLSLSSLAISGMDRSKKNETYKELDIFSDVLRYIQTDYVDDVKPKDLVYGAMEGMLGHLDPYSQFLTPEEYEELKTDTEGKFGGVGIEITLKDGLITIIAPIEDTPGWRAGLKSRDRIVKIDDMVIRNFTIMEAVRKLRGKPGTEVNIVVWREKEGKLHAFKIKRAVIDIKGVKEVKIIEDHVGYLRIVEFREDTPQELERAIKELKALGMESLVIDVRNNPGGLLDKAVRVAEMFLPRGSLIVSIKSKDEKQNEECKADDRSPFVDVPLVLLVNDGSASGSEIVAGAFQDHHRAVIIGAKTFGKGSVQTVLPLRDGSAIKLTTSRYFTPSGKSIHEKGIMPDIVVATNGSVGEEKEAEKKLKNLDEVFSNIEEEKPEDKGGESPAVTQESYVSDASLMRAVDLLKSIKIYENFLKK